MTPTELEELFKLINTELKSSYILSLNIGITHDIGQPEYYLAIHTVDFERDETALLSFYDKKSKGHLAFEAYSKDLNDAFIRLKNDVKKQLPRFKRLAGR